MRPGEAEAIGVGVVTIEERIVTVTPLGALFLPGKVCGQGLLRQPGSECCSGNHSHYVPHGMAACQCVISHRFGEIFKPVGHRLLLFSLARQTI